MIYLGADHGGFELKEKIKEWLKEWKEEFKDLGAKKFDKDDDYPPYAFGVGEVVSRVDADKPWKKQDKGILACRSAAGMVIAANKIKGVRAAAVHDERQTIHARVHNDINVVTLSGDWIDETEARKAIKAFLETEFSHEPRHKRRLKQIEEKEFGGGCCGGGCCQ